MTCDKPACRQAGVTRFAIHEPMHSVKDVLKKFNPLKDKYVSREFQSFGVNLAERLEDARRKGLYIKFAKTIPRPLLEMALRFVIDANAKNKAALFMWKLKEMGAFPAKVVKSKVSISPKRG